MDLHQKPRPKVDAELDQLRDAYLLSKDREDYLHLRLEQAMIDVENPMLPKYRHYLAKTDVELYTRLLDELATLRRNKK